VKVRFVFLLFLVPSVSFASVGENFEKAGYQLFADGYFYTRFSGGDFTASLNGGAGFILVDRFEPYANIGYFISRSYGLTQGLNLTIGASYYFVPSPNANTGFVHSISLSLHNNLFFNPGANYELGIAPKYQLLYFITERIAPTISIVPRFRIIPWGQADAYLSIYFGFSLFLKSKEKVLIHTN
jgi:hypothetical protein